jgi:hypothetical protein
MPRHQATQATFKDDATKDLQVVARNSEVAVILFCGKAHGLGIPLSMIHPWLTQLPASLVYLRDLSERDYSHGVQSLGLTRDATLAALQQVIASLHGRRIVCYGNCAGAFAALDYGLELGANAVLCMGGLGLESRAWDALYEAYSRAASPPRVCIVYGEHQWDDRIQAEQMSTLSCVTTHALENCAERNLIVEVILRGDYEGFLNWLVRPPGRNSFSCHARKQ